MSLDVFGFALQPSVLDQADLHHLVGSTLTRHFPDLAENYPALRQEAEDLARIAAKAEGHASLAVARIRDHLEQVLSRAGGGWSAQDAAHRAIDRELELEQIIARPDPDALKLHEKAHHRGIPIAFITDSYLPRDLIARMLSEVEFKPDYLLVASNEGVTKNSGLYQRLLDVSRSKTAEVLHLGSDLMLDVDQPARLGIKGVLGSRATHSTRGLFELGLTARSGVDSIALALADNRFRSRGATQIRPEDIGYYAGGPLASGFAAWIGRQVDDQRPDQVLFCGSGAGLIERVTRILRPDLRSRLVVEAADDGVDSYQDGLGRRWQLPRPVREGGRVLVVESGLDGRSPQHLQGWARQTGRNLDIRGAYLGLRQPNFGRETVAWAFGGKPRCAIERHLRRRPEIIEALLRSYPSSTRELDRPLRTFAPQGRRLEAGAIAFAEDFQPWVRLDYRDVTPALVEPALRVISNPTPAEASILGEYPGSSDADHGRPIPLAVAPRRLRVTRQSRPGAARSEAPLWPEGYRALTGRP